MKAKVQMEIDMNGKIYQSFVHEVDSIQKCADALKDFLIEASSLSMQLEDGSYLILGESALKSSAILIKPVE